MAADTGLRRDAIGLREVLFQSITDMAPGAAIAASIPAGAALAGGALPLAVVLALVACLFSAWSIGQLARELPSSGSMATTSSARRTGTPESGAATTICEPGSLVSSVRTEMTVTALRKAAAAAVKADVIKAVAVTATKAHLWVLT